MNNIKIFFFAIITGTLISNLCFAASHSLYGYQINKDGKTNHDYHQKFQSVSSPEKKGWRDYTVSLNVEKSYKDDKGNTKQWVDKINIHFTGQKAAEAFSRVMASDKGTDLYYDFSENSYNSKAKNTGCASAFIGLFCRDFPVTVISYHDLDADDMFALDAGAGKNVPLIEYLDRSESGKLALLEDVVQEDFAMGPDTDDTERGISPKHDLKESKCKCKQGKSGVAGIKA